MVDDSSYLREEIQTMFDEIRHKRMWGNIHRAAYTNPTLQSALDQCILIYKLSKEYEDGNDV